MEETTTQPAQTGEQETEVTNPEPDLTQQIAQGKLELETAQREVEFYKGFTPLTSKYQSAGEFQDKIKEKVMAGYDIEDATVAVLSRENKLNPPETPAVKPIARISPVGGSATTTLRNSEKPLNEMSSKDIREELMKLEYETGGLSNFFNKHIT